MREISNFVLNITIDLFNFNGTPLCKTDRKIFALHYSTLWIASLYKK